MSCRVTNMCLPLCLCTQSRRQILCKLNVIQLNLFKWLDHLPNCTIYGRVWTASVKEVWSMPSHEYFRCVHYEQHQHEIDAVVLEPAHCLPPTLEYSVLAAAFAFLRLPSENKFDDPHLAISERF